MISEQPRAWIEAVRRWSGLTRSHRTNDWPDRNTEYFFYQTLVGAWPICADRLAAHMEKASREAKAHTSWTSPNIEYETALGAFVRTCLADSVFMQDVGRFVEPLVTPGRVNSLAQTLIKLTAPGVPDFYQGSELWTLHLVDPDNRGPIDYDQRRRALAEVKSLSASSIWQRADEGLPKLWVIHAALQLRHRHPETFGTESRYTPVHAHGPLACHVVAFRRGDDVMTIVPRLGTRAGRQWSGTTIPVGSGVWHNPLTGRRVGGDEIDVAELWQDFPVALLERIHA